MPLQPGTRLGPYEILSPIDAGDGSERYKASDAQRILMVQLAATGPAATGFSGPAPTAGLVVALNWASSIKK